MYIYFDKNRIPKEIINDEAIVKSGGKYDIYAYYDSHYMASTGWGDAEKTDITENGFFIEEPNEHFFQNRVMYDKEKWFYYSAPY